MAERKNKNRNRERDFKEREFKTEERTDIIIGRNPVIEALKSGREIEKIVIADGAEGSVSKIAGMARDRGIVIHYNNRAYFEKTAGGKNHQGVIAFVAAHRYSQLEDIFAKAEKSGEPPFIIILDNLEDPHNLGAVMRTAECAGAHGVIIPKRRAVGLTETVAKAAAGALEYIPCVKVANIAQTIDKLKEKRPLDCGLRYGRHRILQAGSYRQYRNSYRQRGRRHKQACQRKMRLRCFHAYGGHD